MTATTTYLLQIAIPRPLRTVLSYKLDAKEAPVAGIRVIVPLGQQHTVGMVLSSTPQVIDQTASDELKSVMAVLDTNALPDTHWLELVQWAARYYHQPLGEALFSALPNALRKAKPLSKRLHRWLAVSTPAEMADFTRQPVCELTEAQQHCLEAMLHTHRSKPLRPTLLHGITGSGKTEVYLSLIAPHLQAGQQVLVIVPEIGLTPQLVQRFQRHFGTLPLVCLHSGLREGERLQAWLQARSGQARIIIGTRSAIFTPAPHLGLIVIDEEHDASLKQQEGFRYHARDLALKRAHMLGIPVVLGSATPSLESLHKVQVGRFAYQHLDQRPGNARPPSLHIQDTRPLILQSGLSPASLQALHETLERGEQGMVFINRRGFAPALYCPSCGWYANCPQCSANMTWHARRNRLLCHHCGLEQATPATCPACQHPGLTTQGQGTERLELALQAQFPDYPVIRVDRDTTSRKGELEDKLETVHSNEPLLLVGTQMLAKGHDFPNLTQVVILEIDQSLFSTDYRALERLGQLLVQVTGRAGRAGKPGQVILQTTQPAHPRLRQLLEHGYTPFAQHLLQERQRWGFPPYSHQALIRASATHLEAALQLLEHTRQLLASHKVQCFGPAPAPLEKRANRYRAQLLISSHQRPVLHAALHDLLQHERQLPRRAAARWSIDVDPIEFS